MGQVFGCMTHRIFQLTLVVDDYDKAIDFYRNVLGFEVLEDTRLSESKRWVRVAPPGSGCSLLLAKATTDKQRSVVGQQTGGRVFLFMHTDDVERDYRLWSSRGVQFESAPRTEEYGKVVVFADLYGNKWDLIEPRINANGR